MKVLIALPLLALWLAPAELESQEETRADVLSGRVTDLTGRPIVDAQVGATALGSGITRSISTDAEGRYRLFFPRTARQYVLLVKRLGFAPLQRTITRRTNRPEEMTIDVQLEGPFEKVYTDGDNSACLATDTMKNTVYALARQDPIAHVEIFAARNRFVSSDFDFEVDRFVAQVIQVRL